jgi:hypothetical protein
MAQAALQLCEEQEMVEVDFIEIDIIRSYMREEIRAMRKSNKVRCMVGLGVNQSYERCVVYIGRKVSRVAFVGINIPPILIGVLEVRVRFQLPFSHRVNIVVRKGMREIIFYLRGLPK